MAERLAAEQMSNGHTNAVESTTDAGLSVDVSASLAGFMINYVYASAASIAAAHRISSGFNCGEQGRSEALLLRYLQLASQMAANLGKCKVFHILAVHEWTC